MPTREVILKAIEHYQMLSYAEYTVWVLHQLKLADFDLSSDKKIHVERVSGSDDVKYWQEEE